MKHFISKGSTAIPLMMVLGAITTWCAGLSVALFNNQGTVSGLTATVDDIKENTKEIPNLKAEIDWLAKEKGYTITTLSTTTNVSIKE